MTQAKDKERKRERGRARKAYHSMHAIARCNHSSNLI
jgi:hypothetical protein